MNELALRALSRFCLFTYSSSSYYYYYYYYYYHYFYSDLFFHCFGPERQTEPKRRDSSQSRGLPYVNDLMGFLPFAYLMFFPFLDFPCSFSRMIDILKVIDESSSQHRIAVTYLTEERSWVFSSIDQFFEESFFLSMVVVII